MEEFGAIRVRVIVLECGILIDFVWYLVILFERYFFPDIFLKLSQIKIGGGVSSILAFGERMWIAGANGSLYVYDAVEFGVIAQCHDQQALSGKIFGGLIVDDEVSDLSFLVRDSDFSTFRGFHAPLSSALVA
jgi:hypothetical protein